jgi:hypothetical protein
MDLPFSNHMGIILSDFSCSVHEYYGMVLNIQTGQHTIKATVHESILNTQVTHC